MNFRNIGQLDSQIRVAKSAKDGCLTWAEFLDFFFVKNEEEKDPFDLSPVEAGWWSQINIEGKKIENKDPTPRPQQSSQDEDFNNFRSQDPKAFVCVDEVAMTPALEILLNSRKVRTEAEVEAEFTKQYSDTINPKTSF